MKLISQQDPFPHLIIDNFYSPDELKLIWQELDFLCHLEKWNPPEKTGTAIDCQDKPMKNNFGLFLDGVDGIYKDRKISNILSVNRKVVEGGPLDEYGKLSFGYQTVLQSNYDTTLISYYEDSHYYKRHNDKAVMTALTWFYKEPKMFFGGDLIFSDYQSQNRYTVPVKNNRVVLFPSFLFHEVEEICMPEHKPGYGRYCMAQFFMIV
jgi:hypothetical protein